MGTQKAEFSRTIKIIKMLIKLDLAPSWIQDLMSTMWSLANLEYYIKNYEQGLRDE